MEENFTSTIYIEALFIKLLRSAIVPQGKPRILEGPGDVADPQMGPLRVLPGRLSVMIIVDE